MNYKVYSENEPNGEGNGWWECAPEDAQCWSVWSIEDNEPMDLEAMFDTEIEAVNFMSQLSNV